MKHRKTISHVPIQVVALLAAFGLAQPALSDCVQSDPAAATIVDIDATSGCTSVQGQEGCTIDKVADGSCSYDGQYGKFTVRSELIDGKLYWKLDGEENATTKIDTAIIGGGSGGKNNCGYVHEVDVFKGSGGDCKGDIVDGECTGDFQNITGLSVCTDGKDDKAPTPPPVAEALPNCSDLNNKLDFTGVTCPIDDLGVEKPVVVCNFEKDKDDWGVTDGSDVCCQCGITEQQTACVVTEDETVDNACTKTMTVDPTQAVDFTLFTSDGDPCTWLRSSSGWVQWCW